MMEFNKESIMETLIKHKAVLKNYGVERLGLFGSFVRNEATHESDIDFLVEFEKGKKNFDNFLNLSFLLENLFKKKIELITPEGLSKYMAPHILKEVEYVSISD